MKNSKITRDQMYLIVWYGRTIIVENSSDKKLRTTNVLLFLLSFPSRATTTTYVFTTHKQNYVLFFLLVSWHLLFKAFQVASLEQKVAKNTRKLEKICTDGVATAALLTNYSIFQAQIQTTRVLLSRQKERSESNFLF